MADADGTISIPFWLKLIVGFIPAPWGTIVSLVVKIIDQLPAPHRDAVRGAAANAQVKGDNAIFTGRLHQAVLEARSAVDKVH